MYLDLYNRSTTARLRTPLPNNSQFKCYDGMHNWNQLQPAPYDGMYQFPSVTGMDPTTGKPDRHQLHRSAAAESRLDAIRTATGTPMLPRGKYVVEVVVPPGYELVKEEDKNILIGDNYIAPVTQQFPGFGSAIFILPDQAEVGCRLQRQQRAEPDQRLGQHHPAEPRRRHRQCRNLLALRGRKRASFPTTSACSRSRGEVAPFAGATRNLCDRKEVTLDDQTSALAKFYVFTSTHVAAHFTGVITDDFTSEFDPFSPQFGEKFSPPNLPDLHQGLDRHRNLARLLRSVGHLQRPDLLDLGSQSAESDRLCADHDGHLHERPRHGTPIPDPLFNPEYSQFCYEIPFMPGQTQYMDTPVVPDVGVRRSRLQQSRLRLSGCHAGHQGSRR